MRQAPKVIVDNDCSQQYTVIDVFAMDTQGLLFTLAQTIHEHGLNVHLARIATSVDQVVDVFYVSDLDGAKITESTRLYLIRQRLLGVPVRNRPQCTAAQGMARLALSVSPQP